MTGCQVDLLLFQHEGSASFQCAWMLTYLSPAWSAGNQSKEYRNSRYRFLKYWIIFKILSYSKLFYEEIRIRHNDHHVSTNRTCKSIFGSHFLWLPKSSQIPILYFSITIFTAKSLTFYICMFFRKCSVLPVQPTHKVKLCIAFTYMINC